MIGGRAKTGTKKPRRGEARESKMIYNGCKVLMQYGYKTDTPYCELCALDSNDINIEEHEVVRSSYLDRTREVARHEEEIDWAECNSFADESSTVAGMSSDEDDDGSRLGMEGNSFRAQVLPSVLERPNEGVRGFGNVRAVDLTDAVNIGISFSEMIQFKLRSASVKSGYPVSVMGPPYDGTLSYGNATLAQPPTETDRRTFSIPPSPMKITYHDRAPCSENMETPLAYTSQTFPTGKRVISSKDLGISGRREDSTHSTVASAAACRHNALTGNISTAISSSIQPGWSKASLPSNNVVVSRAPQLPNAQRKPHASHFSAEWLMVSSQPRTLDKGSFIPSVQRKTPKNNAPARGRTRRKAPRGKGSERLRASTMSSFNYHNLNGHGLVGSPSSISHMAVNLSMGRNEQVAGISKGKTQQIGKPSPATQPNPYGSLRAPNNENHELVMTPLARQLYTSGDSTPMANPWPSLPSGSISGNTFSQFTPYSTTALTVPPRKKQKMCQIPTNRSEKALTSAASLKMPLYPAKANRFDGSDEILIRPLVKKLHPPGTSVRISKPRTTSKDNLAKVNVGRCSRVSESIESVITHSSRPTPLNKNSSEMNAVNLAPPETVTTDPAATGSAGALFPWTASSSRTVSVNHGIDLRLDIPLPPLESIGHIQSREIDELLDAAIMSIQDEGRRDEDIEKMIDEWLTLTCNNTEELPSPHPSLLSTTSVDSGEPAVPGSTSIKPIRDSGCPIGPAPLPTASGDPGGPTFMSKDSAGTNGSAPLLIMSVNSVCPIGPEPQNNDNLEQSNQGEIQATVPTLISGLQNRVSKPRNRRKPTVPRKKRPKTLKQPTTRGKVASPPSPPSRKNIEHFIVVCGGEAFRVNSRVLEEASPVVRDFSKTCLEAGTSGDCFFEVLGVTPWAMHELLKYICRTSYNRTLMRSSYMKNLAEKLKIKINSDGTPQQDLNDASSANPQSMGDEYTQLYR